MPLPEDRPVDATSVHTVDLPATPTRDRTIPATAWIEAPAELLELGRDLGHDLVAYKRRIGPWLLWRAGPAAKGDARYAALAGDDPRIRYTFRLHPSGDGEGVGPDGEVHHRFRTWKEALRDHGPTGRVERRRGASDTPGATRARTVSSMERQAGLGRSLEDVLDSLTPVEPGPAGPGRALFEPEDLEQQLDQLMSDITALRERVQHLVGLVPEDAVLRVVPDPTNATKSASKKKKKKKKKSKG